MWALALPCPVVYPPHLSKAILCGRVFSVCTSLVMKVYSFFLFVYGVINLYVTLNMNEFILNIFGILVICT